MQKSSNLDAEIARDAICTCKSCNHEIARDCMKVGCTCCKEINHSMILDGIEGFASLKSKQRSSSSDEINEKRRLSYEKESGKLLTLAESYLILF